MSYSEVPRIQLNQGNTITLEVEVYGFETGNPVEIFGVASQLNGAVAPFYKVVEMPEHDEGKSAFITLDKIPAITSNTFNEGLPITVVARAADAWITILSPGEFESQAIPLGTGVYQAGWNETGYSPAVSPDAEKY